MKQTTFTRPGAPGRFILSITFVLHIAKFWLFVLFYMDVSLGFVTWICVVLHGCVTWMCHLDLSILYLTASCDGCHA